MRNRLPREAVPQRRARQRYYGPPATLGDIRANGIRCLDVSCWNCHHNIALNVDAYGDDVPVPWFGPRMVCTRCGIIGADARPNWRERPEQPSQTGRFLYSSVAPSLGTTPGAPNR